MTKAGWTVIGMIMAGMAFFGVHILKIQARGALQQVKNYTIYYGSPTIDAMAKLKKTDLAVIEPQLYTKQQIEELKSAGTRTIAYISVMEAPAWNGWRSSRLQPDDYLLVHGRKVHLALWDAYVMDLRQISYRQLLLQEIKESAVDKGFDGVFLDTVGDIDEQISDASVRQSMQEAYGSWLRQVRERYVTLLLIQNRGFDSLEAAAPFIQGFLWEDWRSGWFKDAWSRIRVARLQKEQKKGLRVFAVSSNGDSNNATEARKLGFIHLDAPKGYYEQVP
ncbi:endo alpha-1,4 polygalactosaminidase [Paenibacillus filicis]|uniref:Endo alpha-1,4 polygalactosaminidase n=1 Tax=Paenibacillus gyeongsangnamensis TaxID=3388067 RepID=A0ABT4QCT0_9BACL|nr:endo alpha-1,4 polygalactosaminidase [Paenibacillus filicis]MCZ8514664.1 endo alpha-1,4 polygalactosaminidase [Paenibacillus filicis]